mgnify:CR=1 FL=1
MENGQLGFDMVFVSNVTIGGGISSSAAVEVGSRSGGLLIALLCPLHRTMLGN